MPKIPRECQTGVYKILNTVTGKVYVGSAAVSFKVRWTIHRADLRGDRHFNHYLQRSWNKHGEKAFRFIVLDCCLPEQCLEREQQWLDELQPYVRDKGYNLSKVAGSAMQGRNHTEESRKKMSLSQKGNKGQVKATIAAAIANKGKKRSEAFCKNLSDKLTGRGFSEEHKANIKATHWTKQPGAREIIEHTAALLRGRQHTEEHKKKISAANYRRWDRYREQLK